MALSEDHITLTKRMYNWRLFGIITLGVAWAMNSVFGMQFPPGTLIEDILLIVSITISGIMGFYYIAGLALLKFQPSVVFAMKFEEEPKKRAELHGNGKISKTMHEIHTLKLSLQKRDQKPLAVL